ncbi:MAG: Heme peroxidase [Polaromonas sp.]|jgi:predicted phage-related endonuclease
MIEHTFLQQSPEWYAHRATARNASDAAVIMGRHPTRTRDEWLHKRFTGVAKEHSQFVQDKVFAPGHAIEAAMRSVAESIIGEDLGPVVGSATVDGIELSASFDGITLMGSEAWECKTLNAQLRSALPVAGLDGLATNHSQLIAPHYQYQMQQQCMVSGCTRILFTSSDGAGDDRHCWFYPNAKLGADIIAAWKQADIDLAAYIPPTATAAAPTGRTPETLPALLITVKGEVTDSNLANFKDVALTAIRSVNRDLKNDQDFADADKAVKWCDDIETRVVAAKEHALSQTQTIDQLFKTLDDIKAEARQVRLDLGKLITARKASLKTELLTDIQTQWADYLREINKRIGKDYMPQSQPEFAGAIHGKKNFDSMRSALNTTLANAKIEASAKADLIQANIALLRTRASAHKFLFSADIAGLVLKATADLDATITARISEHDKAEADKLEKQREAIRAEEQAKAEAAARTKLLAEQEAERLASEAAKPVVAPPAPAPAAQAAPAANVVPLRAAKPVIAPAPATPPSLKLAEIGERLDFQVTGAFLKNLGFEPAMQVKNAVLFHEADFTHICAALIQHIKQVQARQAA